MPQGSVAPFVSVCRILPLSSDSSIWLCCCIWLIACVFCTGIIFADTSLRPAQAPTIRFETLSLEHGLSQGTIPCILQDKKGFLWFATQDGLNRYDGYGFTVFKHDALNANSIADSDISSLYEDSYGNIWVGTVGGGLNKYDPKRGIFTAFRHDPSNPNSLSSNSVTCIVGDTNGMLWVGTENAGLNRFDPNNGTVTRFAHYPNNPNSLSNNVITAVYEDKQRTLWVGTMDGLNKYDRERNLFSVIRSEHSSHSSLPTLAHNSITAITQDNMGALWVGTTDGLNRLTFSDTARTQLVWSIFRTIAGNPHSLGYNHILSVYQDPLGRLWVGTRGGGLHWYNSQTQDFTVFRNEAGNPYSLANNIVRSVYQDRQGILWVGTSGNGICKYDAARYAFTTIRNNPKNINSLANNIVWSLCEDRSGVLWIGTFEDGVNRYDRSTETFSVFRHNPKNNHSLSNNGVNCILEDRRGTLWMGTNDGLNIFDRKRNVFTVFRKDTANPHSLAHSFVRCLYEDRSGVLWIGTKGGLQRVDSYDADKGLFVGTTFCTIPNDPQSLSHDNVSTLYEDHRGVFWVGTLGGGLSTFDRVHNAFTVFRHDPANPKSLTNNAIFAIYEDRQGVLWIGTNGGGLNKFNRERGDFTAFQEKDGLPNGVIYGILEDGNGNLWMSTNRGLVQFNASTNKFRTFTAREGLQSDEFNRNAYLKAHDGRMYFGGNEGLNGFYPTSIRTNPYTPPVVLTDFKKFNRSATLDSSIAEMHTIELSYKENFVSFEFAALNYTLPEKNRYQYKLENFDAAWIDAGTKREATYTNLDGGTYIFRVRGSNNDDVWNNAGAMIRVIVHPPWWETLWFRLGGVVVLIVGIVAGFRIRTRQIRQQKVALERKVQKRTVELRESNLEVHRQLEILDSQAREIEMTNSELQFVNTSLAHSNLELSELNKEKNEIMGIVAHDLKNPLSNIKMLAKLMRHEAVTLSSAEVEEFATDIQNSSERMFDLILNLLNVNAIEQGGIQLHPAPFDMRVVVQSIAHNYKQSAEAKFIQLRINTASELGADPVQVFADRNATVQIVDNLISNAVKYSPLHKAVTVCIKPNLVCKRVRIEIQDEGPGLSEDDKKMLFGKFARLSAQPTGGESSTGLGLSIVKKLAEVMNGNVWCESELGRGATFVVELPIAE